MNKNNFFINAFKVGTLPFIIMLISIIFNIIIYGGFVLFYTADLNSVHLSVSEYSNALSYVNNEYIYDIKYQKLLKTHESSAFLIDDNGKITWEYNKPQEIQNEFTLTEVASFSRWYLNDYPAKVWTRDDGLFVLLEPQNSIWKYLLTLKIHHLQTFVWFLPLLFLFNFLIIFYVCYHFTKKWQQERECSRSQWISSVSHDIRTPLSMILGYSATLKNDETLTPKQYEHINIIFEQSEIMTSAIGNINMLNRLDFSTISGKTFSLTKTIRKATASTINLHKSTNHNFHLEISDNLYLIGDENLFLRLIQNIINNSIKHNKKGCNIYITAFLDKNYIKIKIYDDGKGYSDKQITLLNKSRNTSFEINKENGLGLFIVKKIAILHKGKIVFDNFNGGACVSMVFKTAKNSFIVSK